MVPVVVAGVVRGAGALSAAAPAAGQSALRSSGARLLNNAWNVDGAWNLASRTFSDKLPQFQHACTVVVAGGPLADLRRVWYLCAAVAFGKMKRSVALKGGTATMQATWDISGKACQMELVYQVSTLGNAIIEGGGSALRTLQSELSPTPDSNMVLGVPAKKGYQPRAIEPGVTSKSSAMAMIHQGPDQLTVGSGWPDFLLRSGQNDRFLQSSGNTPETNKTYRYQSEPIDTDGIPTVEAGTRGAFNRSILREAPEGALVDGEFLATGYPIRRVVLDSFGSASGERTVATVSAVRAPTLPDDGRIVTSGEKSHPGLQPPRPIIDGCTRTSLVSLFAATLTDPCFLPEAPPTTWTPLYSRGIFLHDSGLGAKSGQDASYDQVAYLSNDQKPKATYVPPAWEGPNDPADTHPDGKTILVDPVTDFRGK